MIKFFFNQTKSKINETRSHINSQKYPPRNYLRYEIFLRVPLKNHPCLSALRYQLKQLIYYRASSEDFRKS